MAKLTDDRIRWILDLNATGVQSELNTITSEVRKLYNENKLMNSELKAAEKQFQAVQKEMQNIERAGKKNSDRYRELESTLGSVSDEITGYRRKIIENTRAIEDNKNAHNRIIATMKIEDMTMNQLGKRAESLKSQLNDVSKAASPETFKKLQDELGRVNTRMTELSGVGSSASSILENAFSVFGGNLMTSVVGSIASFKDSVVQFFSESIEMATKADGISKAFKRIADENYLNKLREQTQGLLSDMELMESAVKAEQFSIPLDQLGKLLAFAQQRAQDTGDSVEYLTESIINGIGRKSPRILDNLGISMIQLQAEVKKTGDFAGAVGNIIDEEMSKNTASIDTAAAAVTRKDVAWQNLKLATGGYFVEFKKGWDNFVANFANGIANMIRGNDDAIKSYNKQLEKVAELEVNIRPLAERYDELKAKTSLSKKEHDELSKIMNTISKTIPGVTTQFDKYGNALEINTKKVYGFIDAEKMKLKFMNKDAIEETNKLIKSSEERIRFLQRAELTGKRYVSYGTSTSGAVQSTQVSYTPAEMDQLKKDLATEENNLKRRKESLKNLNGEIYDDQLKAAENKLKQRNQYNSMTKKQLEAEIIQLKKHKSDYLEVAEQIYKNRFDSPGDVPKNDKKKKGKSEKEIEKELLNRDLELLETKHQERLSIIKNKYNDGDIKSQSDYDAKLFAQDQSYYLLRENFLLERLRTVKNKDVKADINKEISEIENKRLDQEIKFRAELEKIILDSNPLVKENKEYDERLRAVALFGVDKLSLTKEQTEALEFLEKQHQDNIDEINKRAEARRKEAAEKKYNEKYKSRFDEVSENIATKEEDLTLNKGVGSLTDFQEFDSQRAIQQEKINLIVEEINAMKELGISQDKIDSKNKERIREEKKLTSLYANEFKRRYDIYKNYGDKVGASLASSIENHTSLLDAFRDSALDILFDVLSQTINTEIAKLIATGTSAIGQTTANSIATKGPLGIAEAAVLTGLITAAITTAKAGLRNLLSGNKSSSSSSSGKTGRIETNSGYADGGFHSGYTGEGNKYDIRGYFPDGQPYHAGEYIIPRELMPLPFVNQMIRTIEPLRQKYVSTSNPIPEGFAQGGYHSVNSSSNEEWIDRLIDALDAFTQKEISVNYYTLEKVKKKVELSRNLGQKR